MINVDTIVTAAAAGGTVGAVLVKILDYFIAKKTVTRGENQDLVTNWQSEVREWRDTAVKLTAELDKWKTDYFKLYEEHCKLVAEFEALKVRITQLEKHEVQRR